MGNGSLDRLARFNGLGPCEYSLFISDFDGV